MSVPVLRATPAGRWDPWRDFTDLQDQMGQLMQTVFEPRAEVPQAWRPLADLYETEDAYVMDVELPGVKKDDVDIEVTGNELTISGEVKEKEKIGLLRSRTRRIGRFEYHITLPHDIDPDSISAELDDGVLTVRVPKSQAGKPRRIPISGRH